jgi:hypothetical protein
LLPAQLDRCKRIALCPNLEVNVAAPEDVILGKLVYYSEGGLEKHLRDIAGIIKVSGDMVDRGAVNQRAGELGVAQIWRQLLERVS